MNTFRNTLLPFAFLIVITLPTLCLGFVTRLLKHRPLHSLRKLSSVRTILIVRYDGIGDVLLTAGLAADLKIFYPNATVLVVVDHKYAEFAKMLKGFDEVIGYEFVPRSTARTVTSVFRYYAFCRQNLWSRQIDLCINPRWDRDIREFGVMGYLSLCRSHLGYEVHQGNDKHLRNPRYNLFYSDLIPDNGIAAHEIERHREIIRYLGGKPSLEIPEFPLSPSTLEWAARELGRHEPAARPLAILGLGSSTPRRTWPAERFLEVAMTLEDFDFLVIGSGADGELAERSLRPALATRLKNFGGKCGLDRSTALASFAAVYIGNNSAAMHLAACSQVPVVDICCHVDGAPDIHDQSPVRFTAQYAPHVVVTPRKALSGDCVKGCISPETHCIQGISSFEVIAATGWLLGQPGSVPKQSWYPLTLWSKICPAQAN